jgi:hypothetical protein
VTHYLGAAVLVAVRLMVGRGDSDKPSLLNPQLGRITAVRRRSAGL